MPRGKGGRRSPIKYDSAKQWGGNKQYRITQEEADLINEYRRIHNEAIEQGIDPSSVKHGWIKSDKSSLFFKNPNYKDGALTEIELGEIIDRIVEKHKGEIKKKPYKRSEITEKKALKVTLSDSHVGMNPNPNNGALFQYEYNDEIYNKSMGKVYESILKEYNIHGVFDLLLIDDLGDMADGFNGLTTRGGHSLPQNMTNAEVFETCLDAKVELIRKLVNDKISNKIILRCVCNDNHAGDFGLIINKAIQKVINLMYSSKVVEVDMLTRFIEHRTYGKHCFVLTHGKDKEHMRSGLPLILNDRAIRLINDYLEHYQVDSKYIHVEKGDLHQIGYQRTKKFDYRNFMSLAPPSSWIQHNFGDSYSGYSIQIIPKNDNEISHTDYFLNYKKVKK